MAAVTEVLSFTPACTLHMAACPHINDAFPSAPLEPASQHGLQHGSRFLCFGVLPVLHLLPFGRVDSIQATSFV